MPERRPSPAVYGIETEYSCLITMPNDVQHELVGGCHSLDKALGLYAEPDSRGAGDISNIQMTEALEYLGLTRNDFGMLSNGGRLYSDPSGPEYATPEAASAEDAVHRSFEGDKILFGAYRWLMDQGIVRNFQINRRVVDHNRTSRGVHLNTLTKMTKRDPSKPVALWLATLNVAKGALFGSGGLLMNESGETEYHHSPRLSITSHISGRYSEYKSRPLVRTPFKKDYKSFSRMETVTSDALNFGWPIRASLVATNALVGLIEIGRGDKLPNLNEKGAIFSANNVGKHGARGMMIVDDKAKDTTKFRTSLDVLRQISETLLTVNESEDYLDQESVQVINEIIDTADKMADDPNSTIKNVESVARLAAMERKMERTKSTLASERLCRYDYAWDLVGGGIAEDLRRKGVAGWLGFGKLPSHSETQKRMVTPPGNTRAKIRANLVAISPRSASSHWDKFDLGSVRLPAHPLTTELPQDIKLVDISFDEDKDQDSTWDI